MAGIECNAEGAVINKKGDAIPGITCVNQEPNSKRVRKRWHKTMCMQDCTPLESALGESTAPIACVETPCWTVWFLDACAV